MKAKLRIFRLPRKIVFIIGGVLLLGGSTGAFAVYVGKDKLLGASAEQNDGLACQSVKTFKIKKKDRLWVRKFIKLEQTDGLTRVRTALRVAHAVYDAQQPDLVQVVVLDKNGPELRADMRGRAVGADVVYVPHPEKLPDLAGTPVYSAKYIDGDVNSQGQFYGEKIEVTSEDVDHLLAALTDHQDCSDSPEEAAAKEAAAKAHGAKTKSEHGAAPAEGEAAADSSGHGAPAAEEHVTEPVEDHAAPAAGEHGDTTPGPSVDNGEAPPQHVADEKDAAHGEASVGTDSEMTAAVEKTGDAAPAHATAPDAAHLAEAAKEAEAAPAGMTAEGEGEAEHPSPAAADSHAATEAPAKAH